jgi:cobalt-zinc-cadmium efflux system outer membrane protein
MWVSLIRVVGGWSLLLLVGLSVSAFAGENGLIKLTEAIDKTLEKNPGLVAFGYQIQAQQARLTQSQLRPNPELDLRVENFLGSGDLQGMDAAETTLSIGWVLERGKLGHRVGRARAGVSFIESEAEIQRLDAMAETARAFLVSLANQERLTLTQESLMLSKQTLDAVKERVDAGRAPDADLSRAEADRARARLISEDIEHELVTSNHRLSAQWNQFEPDFLRVEGDIYRLPTPDSFATLLAQLDRNPDLLKFLTQRRLREAELRLAEVEAKPSWRINAGIRHLELTNDTAFVAGITIPLPTRNKNQGRIAEARAKMAMADANQAATRLQIKTQLFAVYQGLQHSLHRARTLREEILPRMEQALADTQRAYVSGRYDYFELQLLQGEVLNTRTALVEASIDAHTHLIEIERLTGATMPSSVIVP